MNPKCGQKRPNDLARLLFSLLGILRRVTDDKLRRGHEFRTKTLSHARDCDKPTTVTLPAGLCLTLAGVMKEILLGVASMVAEVFLCERPQPGGVQSSRPRKILFSQHPLNPDVDREGAQPLVG